MTPEQALNHPTWRMGARITIDSATLMNKGFEVIEACWLFDFEPSQVDVVIHPQSTVHAMIEYSDGSVLAQIAATDMRMPIQYALTYPERDEAPVPAAVGFGIGTPDQAAAVGRIADGVIVGTRLVRAVGEADGSAAAAAAVGEFIRAARREMAEAGRAVG